MRNEQSVAFLVRELKQLRIQETRLIEEIETRLARQAGEGDEAGGNATTPVGVSVPR